MRRFNTFAAIALAAAAPLALADNAPAPSTAPVPAGAYRVDKPHTSLTFRVNHMGFSQFTGRFTDVEANLKFDPAHIAASSVSVTVNPKSVSTDNAPGGFLDTIAGEQLLDAAKYPQMTFVSKSVESTGANTFRINGELTMHGVTKPVTLKGELTSAVTDPWGNQRTALAVTAKINRKDWGLTYNQALETGGLVVGEDVKLSIEFEAVAVKDEALVAA